MIPGLSKMSIQADHKIPPQGVLRGPPPHSACKPCTGLLQSDLKSYHSEPTGAWQAAQTANQEVDGVMRSVVVEPAHWQEPEIDAISLEVINTIGVERKPPPFVHEPGNNNAAADALPYSLSNPSPEAWIGLPCGHAMLAYSYAELVAQEFGTIRRNLSLGQVASRYVHCPECRRVISEVGSGWTPGDDLSLQNRLLIVCQNAVAPIGDDDANGVAIPLIIPQNNQGARTSIEELLLQYSAVNPGQFAQMSLGDRRTLERSLRTLESSIVRDRAHRELLRDVRQAGTNPPPVIQQYIGAAQDRVTSLTRSAKEKELRLLILVVKQVRIAIQRQNSIVDQALAAADRATVRATQAANAAQAHNNSPNDGPTLTAQVVSSTVLRVRDIARSAPSVTQVGSNFDTFRQWLRDQFDQVFESVDNEEQRLAREASANPNRGQADRMAQAAQRASEAEAARARAQELANARVEFDSEWLTRFNNDDVPVSQLASDYTPASSDVADEFFNRIDRLIPELTSPQARSALQSQATQRKIAALRTWFMPLADYRAQTGRRVASSNRDTMQTNIDQAEAKLSQARNNPVAYGEEVVRKSSHVVERNRRRLYLVQNDCLRSICAQLPPVMAQQVQEI